MGYGIYYGTELDMKYHFNTNDGEETNQEEENLNVNGNKSGRIIEMFDFATQGKYKNDRKIYKGKNATEEEDENNQTKKINKGIKHKVKLEDFEIISGIDTPPSHILYAGKDLICIKNIITSNTLAISRNNFSMYNINILTLKNLLGLRPTKVYGILGIVNFKKIPCLIYGTDFNIIVFYLGKPVYSLTDLKYITLSKCSNDEEREIEIEFSKFKANILKTNLIFSHYFDLTMPFYQQSDHILNEVNSFLYNYQMVKPFLLNNNIKNKNEFYSAFIDGAITFKNHDINGEKTILFILYRKDFNMNYYECEMTLKFSTDVFNYVCGMKIGNEQNEQFNDDLIKYLQKKNGILFNCSNYTDVDYLKKILPNFNYIKYNKDDFNENNVQQFIEEQNEEIKKTKYYLTCQNHPLTGEEKSEYKQQESSENGTCIFLFNDDESMISVIKYFNQILLTNYFSQYQKKKDSEKQNNEFLQIKENKKIDYFYGFIEYCLDEINKILKNHTHYNYQEYLYNYKIENLSEKAKLENLKLFIATYNVSAMEPNTINSKFDVTSFLFPEKYSQDVSKNNLPDIVYFCFEEIVELSAINILLASNQDIVNLYTNKITTELSKHYPYILKQQKSIVGLLTLFYIKSELNDQIDDLTVVENKTGNLGLGNKGNIIIKFKLNGKEIALANAHLSAGEKVVNFFKRLNELSEIFDYIYENKNPNVLYFISGDLNFRNELPLEIFKEICHCSQGIVDEKQAEEKIEELKKYDSMIMVKKKFEKQKLYESEIRFPPTYKYNKLRNTYNRKRIPSWTDRILYKNDNCIKCLFYNTIDLYISDHKPVIGLFQIDLK